MLTTSLDGLSRLPPVRLKSEGVEDDRTPMATRFSNDAQSLASDDNAKAESLSVEGSSEGTDEHSREDSVISEPQPFSYSRDTVANGFSSP